MNIFIQNSYKEYINFTSNHIIEFLEKKLKIQDKLYISLASEYDTEDIYKAVVENIDERRIDFKRIYFLQQTEYIGIPSSNENSKAYFLYKNLFSKINIPKENLFLFDGSKDEEQMKRQEEIIKEIGHLDVIWYSLSEDSTSAGNERISSLSSYFRVKTLSEHSRVEVKNLFSNKGFVPTRVFSMGMGIIDIADSILLTSCGIEKAQALKECLEYGISNSSPLSKLQKHNNVTVITDYESSLRLSKQTIYMNKN